MPESAARKPRTVRAVQDVPLDGEQAPAKPDGRTKAARQARQVQLATAESKVRVPQEQRAVENTDGLMAPINGRYFRLSDSIGLMPLMEWAAAQDEIDTRNSSALLGFFRVLKDLVHEDDWQAFRSYTREQKCSDTEFIAFQNAAMEAIAALPTEAPATS